MVPTKQPWNQPHIESVLDWQKWLYLTSFTWISCTDSMYPTRFFLNTLRTKVLQNLFASWLFVTAMKHSNAKNREPLMTINYSLHFKTLLMIRHVLEFEYPTIETIITCISILLKYGHFESASHVLELAAKDLTRFDIFFVYKKTFSDLFSLRMNNEILEISDMMRISSNCFQGSASSFILYSSCVCYNKIGDSGKLLMVLALLWCHLCVMIVVVRASQNVYSPWSWLILSTITWIFIIFLQHRC